MLVLHGGGEEPLGEVIGHGEPLRFPVGAPLHREAKSL